MPVLLPDYLVPDAAGRIDALITYCFDLSDHLRALRLQDGLEYADSIIEQVRHSLLKLAHWRHVDGLNDELLRIPILRLNLHLGNHVVDLLLR